MPNKQPPARTATGIGNALIAAGSVLGGIALIIVIVSGCTVLQAVASDGNPDQAGGMFVLGLLGLGFAVMAIPVILLLTVVPGILARRIGSGRNDSTARRP